MNFLKTLFSKRPFLFRCNYCNAKVYFSKNFVQQLEYENRDDPVCPPKTECHYCHMGFVIPAHYTSKNGKTYIFSELADKIPTLNPDTFFERLLNDD